MKKIYLYILALSVAGLSASAQDLDPTVVVDRVYEGKLMEVHKPLLEMAVPDSVMRFDLDFDYSVFDNPYKGSYEFNPYLLSMKPSVPSDRSGRFYLRAGAGYQLRPEFDMVWSPKMKEKGSPFHIDVYARHRSYFGKYYLLPSDGVIAEDTPALRGGFMKTKAGVDFGADWDKAAMDVNIGYYGNHRKEFDGFIRNYNALDADFSIGSKDMAAPSGFIYGADVSYRHAFMGGVRENNLSAELLLGAELKKDGRFNIEVGFDRDGYSGDGYYGYSVKSGASLVAVAPHYIYEKGRLYADLGLKISKVIRDTAYSDFVLDAKEQIVYPDVSLRFSLVRNALMLFARATGGAGLVSNSDLIERNTFYGLPYTPMGVEVERLNAVAGLEGRFGSRFNWNLHAGYSNYASGILEATSPYLVRYMPYSIWNAAFEWLWKSDSFMTDGNVTYRDSWGSAFRSDVFKPAALTGDVAFEYNYMQRIYVGVNCGFSTARTCDAYDCVLPGYADLGVSAEYVTSRALSFWIKGGNLLGMTIPDNLRYAVKGPYFTLGISLKL